MLQLTTDKRRRSNHKKYKRSRRESDHLANGDHFDDQEVESELGDAEDEVVTDNGFGLAGGNWANNAHTANQYKKGLGFAQKRHQIRHHHRRESDHLANGDHFDDQEVESELGDAEDEVVTDNGFGLASGNWANNAHTANQYKEGLRFAQKHHRHQNKRHSDEVANGDPTDDKEVEDNYDTEDDIVTDHGFRATVNWPHKSYAQKRSHHHHRRHSDEVANGDATDDKEVQDHMDVHDDIVEDHGFRATVNWPRSGLAQKRH